MALEQQNFSNAPEQKNKNNESEQLGQKIQQELQSQIRKVDNFTKRTDEQLNKLQAKNTKENSDLEKNIIETLNVVKNFSKETLKTIAELIGVPEHMDIPLKDIGILRIKLLNLINVAEQGLRLAMARGLNIHKIMDISSNQSPDGRTEDPVGSMIAETRKLVEKLPDANSEMDNVVRSFVVNQIHDILDNSPIDFIPQDKIATPPKNPDSVSPKANLDKYKNMY